ncbi:hypothetical protein C6P40_003727 [Pichia californica]|uniref:Uncharacterized protein n=1 Tax=Pichia californica TaxID=460514 RepID=A0A9P6WIW4_9ASCO|nr:hypothetical protein C6P40_003727 [[Candida] californica]
MKETILDLFIPDIFDIISKDLTQFDQIALSKTNHTLYDLIIPSIYRSITIDCNFSQFEKEYIGRNTTFIKSKSNFISFIKTLNKNNKLWLYINKFIVIDLPLEFYDFESFLLGTNGNANNYENNNISFFERARLNKLNLDSPVGYIILKNLLNDKYLRENLTIINFNINKYQSIKPFKDIIKDSKYRFQNLNTLSIGPLNNEIKLNEILKLIDLNFCYKLENLKLESVHKTCKLYDLLEFSDDIKLNSSNYIFDYLNTYKNLKSLCLNSINIHQNLLIQNSETNKNKFKFFKNLKYLQLTDIAIISSNSNESLLHTFYKNCDECNLQIIRLDLRSTVDDMIPKFFDEYIKPNQIKELDLVIRYNNMHDTPLVELIDKYLDLVILKHKNSLEKLSIEIKSEKNLISLEEQLQKAHLLKLITNRFDNLKSLRLQVHFDYILLFKILLFQNFSKLENFWIVGSSAIPMHFGQGNMYPGIFDQWWRIIYLPKQLIDGVINHPLHYIKIDECLFLIDRENTEMIQPKNQIDKIFDTMTRVSFDNIIT